MRSGSDEENQICKETISGKVGRCSSSLLAAGRAELRRTQLTRSSRLTTQCYGAQLRWKGWLSIYLDPQPTLSTFQVGGNRSTRRKPTTFGRALTNSSHMSVASPKRDWNPGSQRWKALALTIAPPKPQWRNQINLLSSFSWFYDDSSGHLHCKQRHLNLIVYRNSCRCILHSELNACISLLT